MRFAVLLLVFVGCNTCPGTPISSFLAGGSGTIDVTEVGVTLDRSDFSWSGGSPVRTAVASFTFSFSDGGRTAGIQCKVPWTDLSHHQPVVVTDACTLGVTIPAVDAGPDSFPSTWYLDPMAVEVTVTSSSLDTSGNGDLTVQLDVAATDLVVTDDSGGSHPVHVEITALQGAAKFADESCSSGCSSNYMSGM